MFDAARRRLLLVTAGLAAATLAFAAPARAEQVVVQWQTANLTEPQFEPVWKQMIVEFQAANPDIRIEPILVARKDDWTKFVTAAQARRAPCVVQEDLASAAYNGYLMPLDKFWNAEPAAFRAVYSDAIMAAMHWKGAPTACRSGVAPSPRSTTWTCSRPPASTPPTCPPPSRNTSTG